MKNLAVVGFGDIAEKEHLPAIQSSQDFQLVGVVETNPIRARRAHELTGAPVFESIAHVASLSDAVIIATPPNVTPELITQSVQSNLHVLCEKPISSNLDAALRMNSLVNSRKNHIQVGFVNRFSPHIVKAKELITSGELGFPLAISMGAYDEKLNSDDVDHLSRIINFLSHGSAFSHEGVHLLDYLNFFGFSTPQDVTARGMTSDKRFPSSNFVNVSLTFENGSMANLEVGWLLPHLPTGFIRISGPKGRIEIIRRRGTMAIELLERQENLELSSPWNELAFAGQLSAFSKNIEGFAWQGATLEDGLWNMRLSSDIEAILQ